MSGTIEQKRLRVLVIGGYGVFGGRLVRLLKDDARLTVMVAGRSREKAEALCKRHEGAAQLVPTVLDRDAVSADALRALDLDLVVDASGPFQVYGDAPYRVVEAAIDAGVSYLDLADGSAFVLDIGRFDARARERGVFIVCGASTCPALSGAVVRHLARGLDQVDSIEVGIAPSPFAGVGLNVVRAIAAYAGNPLAIRSEGHTVSATALGDTRRATIAPPGTLPLGNRLFSLVDVPDLTLFAAAYPSAQEVWVGAAPEPELWHRALTVLARLRRHHLVPPLARAAPLFHRVVNTVTWGEARGGMLVRVAGRRQDGSHKTRSWHLVAEGDDGPFIPATACAALIVRMLDGRAPAPGARTAIDALEIGDFEPLLAKLAITAGTRTERIGATTATPIYARALGDAWQRLPAEIRAMHALAGAGTAVARGRATIDRGRGWLSRLIGAVIGFPAAVDDVPVTVRFDVRDGREIWTRDFGGTRFKSVQTAGRGRSEHLIDERFGLVTVSLAAVVENGRLLLVPRRWRILGVPLPRVLMPHGDSHERVEDALVGDGRFHFHVEIKVPLAGLVVRYRGWLDPPERS